MSDSVNAKTIGWLMGIVALLFVGLVATTLANLHSRVASNESTLAVRGERIAMLEGAAMSAKERQIEINARLIRIEEKLEQLAIKK